MKRLVIIGLYFIIAIMPLVWLIMTSFKDYDDTNRGQAEFIPMPGSKVGEDGPQFPPTAAAYGKLNETYAGKSETFFTCLVNSIIIGLISTAAAVARAFAFMPCAAYSVCAADATPPAAGVPHIPQQLVTKRARWDAPTRRHVILENGHPVAHLYLVPRLAALLALAAVGLHGD